MAGAPGVPLRRPTHPATAPRYHVRIKSLTERARWEALAIELPDEMTACWDHLANSPTAMLPNERCHRLKGALATIWQYKPTTGHNKRVWYTVDDAQRRVLVTAVYEQHP